MLGDKNGTFFGSDGKRMDECHRVETSLSIKFRNNYKLASINMKKLKLNNRIFISESSGVVSANFVGDHH